MRLAAELEAMELTVHPGHMTLPGRREESMKLLQDSLEQIGRLSDRIGVDVSLEIMEKIPKEFVTDAQSMEEAAGSRKKQFFYTLDIAHCDRRRTISHIRPDETDLQDTYQQPERKMLPYSFRKRRFFI